MKFACALILFTSLNVFAGPEEHWTLQKCYQINLDQTSIVSPSVPLEICLERTSVYLDNNTIEAYSYFPQYSYLFDNLKLNTVTRKNEDTLSFYASSAFREVESGPCGNFEKLILHISGLAGNDGQADIANLQISVEQETMRDSCHSTSDNQVFTYSLEKFKVF